MIRASKELKDAFINDGIDLSEEFMLTYDELKDMLLDKDPELEDETVSEIIERVASAITEELIKIGKQLVGRGDERKVEFYTNSIEAIAREAFEYDSDGTTLAQSILFYTKYIESVLESYPIDVEIKLCERCGLPMKYKSMAYEEGYHFDTCI